MISSLLHSLSLSLSLSFTFFLSLVSLSLVLSRYFFALFYVVFFFQEKKDQEEKLKKDRQHKASKTNPDMYSEVKLRPTGINENHKPKKKGGRVNYRKHLKSEKKDN